MAVRQTTPESDVHCPSKSLLFLPAITSGSLAQYGNNPSGATTTTERRKEILALASKYNFLILEDDPYYYLYFGSDPRPPSYFSLDTEGRVLRFDSFSKVLSAGLRLAFVSGPTILVRAIDLHVRFALSNPRSLSICPSISYHTPRHRRHQQTCKQTLPLK